MFRYRSGHQGSSQSLIMHCMFRPLSTAYTQYTPDGARPLHLLSQHPFSFMKNVLLVYILRTKTRSVVQQRWICYCIFTNSLTCQLLTLGAHAQRGLQ